MKVKDLIKYVYDKRFLSITLFEESIDDFIQTGEIKWIKTKVGYPCSAVSDEVTNIYECEDGFVGVRGIIPHDEYTAEDINEICSAQEYIDFVIIDYKPKYGEKPWHTNSQ